MPQNEARAWWADVQHVRESIERRRAGVTEAAAPGDLEPARRFSRGVAEPPVPRLEDLDWPPEVPAHDGRRFEHASRAERSERAGTLDDAGPARRRGSAAAEADRAAARGRRPRTEPDLQRPRSHRADDTRSASARADDTRGASPRADDARGASPRADDARASSPPDPNRPAVKLRTLTPGTPPSTSGAMEYDLAAGLGLAPPPPARRTVQITGRTVAAPALPRLVEVERRRPGRRPVERIGPRPDRIALYAVLLGFFLILVAAASSYA